MSQAVSRPDLSLSIPCYNESLTISNTATSLTESFKAKEINYVIELANHQ